MTASAPLRPMAVERRAVDGVDRDVHLGRAAVADPLAVEEHRGVVLLALADDDDAVHRDRAEHEAHRVHRGAIRGVLVAASGPARGGDGGGFGHADQSRARGCGRASSGGCTPASVLAPVASSASRAVRR